MLLHSQDEPLIISYNSRIKYTMKNRGLWEKDYDFVK